MRILTIGGTFNPVHVGHVRLAIEATEVLSFDCVEWIPCFAPRHKSGAGVLPFAWRADLLRIAVGELPGHTVDDIESTLSTPSFTYHTLAALAQRKPGAERYFLLGQNEFGRLYKWYRGRELASLTHFVVALRSSEDSIAFQRTMEEAWPESRPIAEPDAERPIYLFPSGRTVRTLLIPRLEISASLVRERWLAGRDLRLLVPARVLRELEARRDEVTALWTQSSAYGARSEAPR